jgi:hypothetical protein
MKSTLVIADLAASRELDRKTMSVIRGGATLPRSPVESGLCADPLNVERKGKKDQHEYLVIRMDSVLIT